MPFPSAISDYTPLRGSASVTPRYAANQFLCLCPNTVIFKALVNGAPSGTSFAQATFDNVTTGAYTDIEIGQTVLIGTDSDIRNATFIGRVRKAPTSSILYINETSVSIADNDNIWVINDFRIWDKLARLSAGTQLKDYDLTFAQLKPVVYGLQSAYAGVCSGSPSGFTVAFAASALAGTSGATISSYAWTIPSGGTVTAGATNTANVTVRFDAGFYWVKLIVTDSGSRAITRWIPIWSIPADYSSVVTLGFDGASIQGEEGNWTANVSAFYGADTLLDNTLACIVDVEYYNGTETSIVSAVKFIGRLRTENAQTTPDETYSRIQRASYEIEGIGAQLSRIEHLPFTLITKTSPTVWDEIKTLTLWRAIVYTLQEHSTLLNLHSLTFDSTADTFAYPALPTQGGNILSVINDLAVSINAIFQSAPTGECEVVRDARYLTTAQRNALTTVANFTTADVIDFSLSTEEVDSTGKIDASGGFYNSTSGKVTPLLSLAPGMAQGIGETIGSLTRQVLAANATQASAQSELNTRSGHHYEMVRRKPVELSASMPPGYNWLVPSLNQWYTWAIASTDNLGGRVYSTSDRWLCVSVSVTHDNASGSKSVQVAFRAETAGQAGQTITYPPPASINTSIPPIPVLSPYPSLPALPDISLPTNPTDSDAPPYTPPQIISNGNVAVVWSATQVWITQNLLLTDTPTWVEITPPNALNIGGCAWVGNGARGLYVITNDGTDSRFHYTADPFANPPTWVDTDLTAYTYDTVRVASTSGAVYVEGITLGSGGTPASSWSVWNSDGVETARDATSITVQAVLLGDGKYYAIITGAADTDCQTWDSATFISGSADSVQYAAVGCGGVDGDFAVILLPGGTTCYWQLQVRNNSAFTIKFTIGTQAIDCGGGAVPVTAIAYSSDYGATFAAPVLLTGSLSANVGFDIERIGVPTLVGIVGQVEIATTAGGTYSAYGSAVPTDSAPNCIVLPRYQFGSTTTANSGNTPQYLLGSASLSDTDKALWKVTASGATFTDITPTVSGTPGTVPGPNCLAMPFKSGARITGLFDIDDGVNPVERHLMNSITSGTSWTDRGQVDDAAAYVRYRRSDLTMRQLFLADAASGIRVSSNHGLTLITKTPPTTDDIKGIEPY